MAVGDILKMRTVCWRTGIHLGINVYHWVVLSETGAGVTMKEYATAFDTLIKTDIRACLSVNANYRGVGFQKIAPGAVGAEANSVAGAGAGTETGDVLQTQSGMFKKLTNFAGRKYRGRTYIPFPSESFNDSAGNPTSAYTTLLAVLAADIDILQTIVGAGGTATIFQVIWHRATASYTALTAMNVQLLWGTQRRRQQRGKLLTLPF